jgi:hypothetical protein
LLLSTLLFSSCGGGSSSSPQQSAALSGNWQFTMVNTSDLTNGNQGNSGLRGGFLLQNNGAVTGEVVYSNTLVTSLQGPCNSGSAPITGTISGQTISLTATAGSQTYSLTGVLNSDGSMSGTYTASAGPTISGSTTPCGVGTSTGLQWTAKPVPPLTGSITGNFHSASGYNSGLSNQDFPVTGTLTQGENIGASNATITGTLSFINPTTLLSNYPCIPSGIVSVNGQISGNTAVLQLIDTNGANAGQIGATASQSNGLSPVTFDSTMAGYVLHSTGTAYLVNTSACPNGSGGNDEDGGYICLGLNSTVPCQQPITLSPAVISFPSQLLGPANPPMQTITLTNNQSSGSAPLSGLTITWQAAAGNQEGTGASDFNGQTNFTESDNCVSGGETLVTTGSQTTLTGAMFKLAPGQSCTITASFDPQESCSWLPFGPSAPAKCPLVLDAILTVNNVLSVDPDSQFTVPVTGTGLSFVQASTDELDFGAEAVGEASPPQSLQFTNYGATPVQILPQGICSNTFTSTGTVQIHTLPPLEPGAPVPGVQVVVNPSADSNSFTIQYLCDFDPNTLSPNFQIASDTCSGTLLQPQAGCGLQIAFVPQSLAETNGQDDFLELNTYQCAVTGPPSQSNPCEIDGGRFPVELKANVASPLRMSPSAGFDFGAVPVGKSGVPQTLTLTNDPSANTTVSFVGKFVVSGNYSVTDTSCTSGLAPGANCTLTINFKPSAAGHRPGSIAINYTTTGNNSLQTQPVGLRGTGF